VKTKAGASGRLIAIEGTRGIDVRAAADKLWRHLRNQKVEGGVSRWDASGTFYELGLGKQKQMTPSPRTLALLYASDLVFRLRWEIRPALSAGQTVIAAPYVESAFAFGTTCGLSRQWLADLFQFAPAPHACYRIRERKKSSGWKGKPGDGFAEFASAVLEETTASFEPAKARARMIVYLDALERRRGCQRLTKKALNAKPKH
jgi:thymidylate kinase